MPIPGCAKLAIGLALSLSLFGCNTSIADDTNNPDSDNGNEVSTSTDGKLSGQWRITDDGSGETATFIFTPEGKLYIISDPDSLAIEVEYEKISDDPTLPANISIIKPTDQVANSKSSKARTSEAKTITAALNRAQQAFHLETATFTDVLQELGLGIDPETQNYSYSIVLVDEGMVTNLAIAKDPTLNSYLGVVYLFNNGEEMVRYAALCESDAPTTATPPSPTFNSSSELVCPDGYSKLD